MPFFKFPMVAPLVRFWSVFGPFLVRFCPYLVSVSVQFQSRTLAFLQRWNHWRFHLISRIDAVNCDGTTSRRFDFLVVFGIFTVNRATLAVFAHCRVSRRYNESWHACLKRAKFRTIRSGWSWLTHIWWWWRWAKSPATMLFPHHKGARALRHSFSQHFWGCQQQVERLISFF